ncbi:nucleoside triphosphate pyrophosphohydrolase [bacterium]|nr:nucleoside triphosphate pyrophosphohydrolase [bacterium]
MSNPQTTFAKFVEIIAKLRDPNGGCPWDLEQTHETLRPYLVEETYELLDAIEDQNDQSLKEELGDVLLQVVLHAQLAKDRGAFDINAVTEQISEKMIRRHPHVFGDKQVTSTKDVLLNWERIKSEEGSKVKTAEDKGPRFMLEGIPRGMPALSRAQRIGQRAAKVHFDWTSAQEVWDKIKEEMHELEVEINAVDSPNRKQRLQHELGDLLFALAQLARFLGFQAEDALHSCSARFTDRFHQMQALLPRPIAECSLEEMEAAWQQIKKVTK